MTAAPFSPLLTTGHWAAKRFGSLVTPTVASSSSSSSSGSILKHQEDAFAQELYKLKQQPLFNLVDFENYIDRVRSTVAEVDCFSFSYSFFFLLPLHFVPLPPRPPLPLNFLLLLHHLFALNLFQFFILFLFHFKPLLLLLLLCLLLLFLPLLLPLGPNLLCVRSTCGR